MRFPRPLSFVTRHGAGFDCFQDALRGTNSEGLWSPRFVRLDLPEAYGSDARSIAIADMNYAKEMLNWGEVVVTFADGFFVDELREFPGVIIDGRNIDVRHVVWLMNGKENRACGFQECIAFHGGEVLSSEPVIFEAEIPGTLATEERGVFVPRIRWSCMDTVFVPEGNSLTVQQMSADLYESWRQKVERGSAIRKFLAWLRTLAAHTE